MSSEFRPATARAGRPYAMKDTASTCDHRPMSVGGARNSVPLPDAPTWAPATLRHGRREPELDTPTEEGQKHMVGGYVFARPESVPRPSSRWRSERDSPRTALEAANWQRSGLAPLDPQAINDMLPSLTYAPMAALTNEAAEAEMEAYDELVNATAAVAADGALAAAAVKIGSIHSIPIDRAALKGK